MYERTGKISYTLEPNALKPGTLKATVQYDRKVDMSYLIQNIQERTALSKSTIQSVILAFIDEIGKEVANGNIVTIDGLCSFRAALRVPTDLADTDYQIIPENADLSIDIRALPEIKRQVEGRATYRRVDYVERAPVIRSFMNQVTASADSLSVNHIIALKGENLKCDLSKPDTNQGVYLIDTSDGVETRATVYPKNTNKNCEFVVPPKTGGGHYSETIRVELRAAYTPNGKIRIGVYNQLVKGSS